jgi:phosphatidylethanolamine-binding protein (PEBP) family uncharacterized protein
MSVEYPHGHSAALGNLLTVDQTSNQPRHVRFPSVAGKFYTLICVDPDAPSPEHPEFRHWLHWMVINLPGTGSDHVDPHQGHTLATYTGPSPPAGTGPHRYCFLVYEQDSSIDPDKVKEHKVLQSEQRKGFALDDFIAKLPETKLHAANFFRTQHD